MLSLSPATRVFLALAPIDGRNHSAPSIIPSSAGKNPKTKAFPAVCDLATRNNQRP
jgi:hypothetical protein